MNGARFEDAGKSHQAQLWRLRITDPTRFESLKSESGELGESVVLESEKYAENFSADSKSAESKNDSFAKRREISSLSSPSSPKPPTAEPLDPSSLRCTFNSAGRLVTKCIAPDIARDAAGEVTHCKACGGVV